MEIQSSQSNSRKNTIASKRNDLTFYNEIYESYKGNGRKIVYPPSFQNLCRELFPQGKDDFELLFEQDREISSYLHKHIATVYSILDKGYGSTAHRELYKKLTFLLGKARQYYIEDFESDSSLPQNHYSSSYELYENNKIDGSQDNRRSEKRISDSEIPRRISEIHQQLLNLFSRSQKEITSLTVSSSPRYSIYSTMKSKLVTLLKLNK